MSWQPTPPTALKHNILAACKLITTGSLEYTWPCPCTLLQIDNSGLFPILLVPTASIPNTHFRFQHGPTENWTFYRHIVDLYPHYTALQSVLATRFTHSSTHQQDPVVGKVNSAPRF
ncbi:hypothetical protein PV10_03051 [Exophiala mesophila]|uniref:Uncharacterized protein n=1 Tax=Exophiala mesophila TaxID=212818 RepID=A0A0D1ZL79_EXOME|nr:uncharacterized protein PV10_03051 [Exophiala mesophila]KIV95387.1 hypothetical protein PV10_03051 [Exophiala mesophila]